MLNLLHTMTSTKCYISGLLLICLFGIYGCKEKEQPNSSCGINGIVDASNPNGIKITLTSLSDNSLKHVAVTNSIGEFLFRDIEAGKYTLEAAKDDYRWIWMVVDGSVNHSDHIIDIQEGQIKEVKILMTNTSLPTMDYELSLTDMYNNPIENSVHVPKYSTIISFKLYNGTDVSHSWSVWHTNDCFVSDDRGFYSVKLFDDFSPISGTLEPGDNITLVGKINQDIWNIYDNSPGYVYSTLYFWLGKDKEVTLSIDF